MFTVLGILVKTKQPLCQAQKVCFLCLYSFFLVSLRPRTLQHLRCKCLLNERLWNEALENTTQTILINYIVIPLSHPQIWSKIWSFENYPEGAFVLLGKPDQRRHRWINKRKLSLIQSTDQIILNLLIKTCLAMLLTPLSLSTLIIY